MDVRHEEFMAMWDSFLGEEYDAAKRKKVEELQIDLHRQDAALYRRLQAGKLNPEEYVDASNALNDEIARKCEKVLGAKDFEKLFGATRAELVGFVDRETFLKAQDAVKPRPQAIRVFPLQNRIVVQRMEAAATTAGGILLPDTAKAKPQKGKVLAVGPGQTLKDGSRKAIQVKVGDEVLFGAYAGQEIKDAQARQLLIMREDDILAVIE